MGWYLSSAIVVIASVVRNLPQNNLLTFSGRCLGAMTKRMIVLSLSPMSQKQSFRRASFRSLRAPSMPFRPSSAWPMLTTSSTSWLVRFINDELLGLKVGLWPQRAQEAYGIYNLTELRSLHAFAAFLLYLRRDMLSMAPICTARMKALSSDADPEILHLWRSDSAFELNADDLVLRDGADDSIMLEAQKDRLERTVRTWYEGVYMSCSLSESEAPSLPVAQKSQGIDMRSSSSSKYKGSKGYDLFLIRVFEVFICPWDSGRSSDRMPPIDEGAVFESTADVATGGTKGIPIVAATSETGQSLLFFLSVSISLDNEDAKMAGDYRLHSVKEMCWRFSWDLLTWSIVLMTKPYVTAKIKYMAERDIRLPLVDKSFRTNRPVPFPQDYKKNTEETTLLFEELYFELSVAQAASIKASRRYHEAADSPKTFAKAAFADTLTWVKAAEDAQSHILPLMSSWHAVRRMASLRAVEDEQPKLAVCDSLVFIDVPAFFDLDVLSQLSDRRRLLELFRVGTRESAKRSTLCTGVDIAAGRQVDPPPNVDGLPEAPKTKAEDEDPRLSYLDGFASGSFISSSHSLGLSSASSLADLLSGLSIDEEEIEPSTPDTEGSDKSSLDLLVGIFTLEHKPKNVSGANQIRLYLTAMVKFLGVIGITDFPVYGLVTEGGIGQLVYAWGHSIKGSVDIRVRIVDRHCICFDLKTLEGALHYACTLAKIIHDEVPRLVELIKAHQEDFNKRAKADPDLLIWNMEQIYGQSGVAAKTDESKDGRR
ncbi:hypothetical protein K488DRAFT_67262 [Vararia minispora EC-137]|uniref:Uncharacterized protein n=1 Tax=Vararia minispora EC-137 TaxID=1314806 RepID=A0ACB8QYY0_9AGAM|nr:hypothetical protein K488DRAFT_67262 [Vararia minispora EC-137]